jgi:hypothetical protein
MASGTGCHPPPATSVHQRFFASLDRRRANQFRSFSCFSFHTKDVLCLVVPIF